MYSGLDEDLIDEPSFSNRRRYRCFWMPCMHCRRRMVSIRSTNWYWNKGLTPFKKIKQWSEFFVIPKLKMVIRRFNKRKCTHGKFRYDPTSYLLNFDEGVGNSEYDDPMFKNFSMRYSSLLVSGNDQPVFAGK
ncbi:uncharacterized protein [Rutidosis leptorrhynchoides]|uniref:uncharacterized protein n=1 Tax=Rutidosis leptorrhynchoides TaxID=125765 RepID=UPI003A992165